MKLRRRRARLHQSTRRRATARVSELVTLTLYLQNLHDARRARLARTLHDEMGALLTSAKLDAARLRSRLRDELPQALDRLGQLMHTLDDGIALKRRIIDELHPSALDHLGLPVALETLVSAHAAHTHQLVHLDVSPDLHPVPLARAAALVMYRVAEYAISQVVRADAARVWLTLQRMPGYLELRVHDDGTAAARRHLPRQACALAALRLRVQAEGGELQVGSGLLLARLPVRTVAVD